MTIRIKRIYDMPSEDDGKRILIDRLWPRGVSKVKAQLDMWLKDVAPSTELRKWYGHAPDKQEAFRNLYEQELTIDSTRSNAVKLLKMMAETDAIPVPTITILLVIYITHFILVFVLNIPIFILLYLF